MPSGEGIRPTLSILLIAIAIFCLGCAGRPAQTGFGDELIPVRFTYVSPRAKEVSLAGSFNGWSPTSHHMTQKGKRWTIEVLLQPGRYTYAFVVDGDGWQPDPDAPLWEDSGFGARSSVLIVE
jgi:1,4-alpha-glucan branching enzyme